MKNKKINNLQKRTREQQKSKHAKFKNYQLKIISLFISFLLISLSISTSLVLSQDSAFFGGGTIPSTFSGDNYRVYGASLNPQFTQPGFYGGYGIDPKNYWMNFNKEDCDERQDVILMIPPGGCSPSIVRSDLLEEQNVPVFCKVSSIQVNPLIDVSKIRSIHFKGQYPRGVSGISYYPARVAVRSGNQMIGSPIIDNVGYLVVVLSRVESEKDMPEWIEANITAVIDYDSEGVFGVGEHEFYLPQLNDEDWNIQYNDYGFWKGKGFIRAEAIDEQSVRISIYKDPSEIEASVSLKQGETSRDIYLDGYYCAAGMNIKVEDISYPIDTALLRVDDEEIWVSKGSRFLDGRCLIRNVEVGEVGGGKVSVSCPGSSFDLILEGASVGLKSGGEIREVKSGDLYKTTEYGANIYTAYVGKEPDKNSKFVVLIRTADDEISFNNKRIGVFVNKVARTYSKSGGFMKFIRAGWGDIYDYIIDEIHHRYNLDKEDIKILTKENPKWEKEDINLESIFVENVVTEEEDKTAEEKLKEDYYKLAVESYNEVFELYPNEEKILNDKENETYAARALYNAADLAGKLNKQTEQVEFLEKLIENYPSIKLANDAEIKLEKIYSSRFSADSQGIVYINNEPHFISLFDFKEPSYDDLGAELLITDNKETKTFKAEKDDLELTQNSKVPFKVIEINEDSIKIKHYADVSWAGKVLNEAVEGAVGKTIEIKTGQTEQIITGVSIKLVKTNLNRVARVKIIPKTFGMRTESDFTFKIGIEKRAIKLSPEKTQEMIDNLEKSIKDWESVNEKLGKVVSGLKAACFATSAMLVVKNFIAGRSGEAMARNEVMTTDNGWNDLCAKWSGEKAVKSPYKRRTYSSVDSCLRDHNDLIEKSVQQYKAIIEQENKNIKAIEDNYKKSGDILDWEGQVDYEKVKQEYCDTYFADWYDNEVDKVNKINIKGVGEQPLDEVIAPSAVVKGNCTADLEDMKLLRLKSIIDAGEYNGVKIDDPVLKEVINTKLQTGLRNTYDITQLTKIEGILKQALPDISPFRKEGRTRYQVMSEVSKLPDDLKSSFNDVDKVFSYYFNGREVVVGLVNTQGDKYETKKAYYLDGTEVNFEIANERGVVEGYNPSQYFQGRYGIDEFTIANSGLYKNQMRGEIKVRYFERAPYQGLPQLVPFDKENGWYVRADYVLSGFGQPYEENGRAVNFWICNVGEDGVIDDKSRDDCRYYNLGSSADLKFPGLSEGQSAELVNRAEKAIRQAADQYGKSKVTILGQVFNTGIAENGETGRCSDFMSPKDCHLLFNVCDPVMCPESRCDFGGKYRVSNVVQSGIIGSLLLCLPNANEGIMIPICLSGVHAGLEGYLSILKSTQDCLKESLETGRNIGICDEIKSIYLCEFFWRQAVPLMDVFIPRLFEMALGQGVRGGGEYLTVQYAWDNVKNSIDYFKNEYAVNAIKAFNSRSTEEVGGEVCKMFVSARYPASSDFFENLIEPDSPVQYNAWFSENILTEATIPPTSHYKVYYHIYAGKDIGAHYVVYLKNPPESYLVHTLGTYVVDRGYIPRGSQLDEARDFTSVSGYQELCISINGQEECGFKQVSTSWAIDELANRYAAEQASETQITRSEDCIAGTTSLYSLAQPNLQAGVEKAIDPELYKLGVIRVCSSENPGKQVLPSGELDKTNSTYDRWKRVGYCDSSEIGCWLDTESVKNVLKNAPNLTTEVLDEIDLNYVGKVESLTPEQIIEINVKANSVLDKKPILKDISTNNLNTGNVDKAIEGVIAELKAINERGGATNNQKADALFKIGQIYDLITQRIYDEKIAETKIATEEGLIEENLRKGVWIKWIWSDGVRTGYCRYKFENNKWYLEKKDPPSSSIGAGQMFPVSLDCLEIKGTYFSGISQIAEQYSKVTIDEELLEAPNLEQKIRNKLIELEKAEWHDRELVESIDIKVYLKGFAYGETTFICKYEKGWKCDAKAPIGITNKLKDMKYVEGIKFLVRETNRFGGDSITVNNVEITKAGNTDEEMENKIFKLIVEAGKELEEKRITEAIKNYNSQNDVYIIEVENKKYYLAFIQKWSYSTDALNDPNARWYYVPDNENSNLFFLYGKNFNEGVRYLTEKKDEYNLGVVPNHFKTE